MRKVSSAPNLGNINGSAGPSLTKKSTRLNAFMTAGVAHTVPYTEEVVVATSSVIQQAECLPLLENLELANAPSLSNTETDDSKAAAACLLSQAPVEQRRQKVEIVVLQRKRSMEDEELTRILRSRTNNREPSGTNDKPSNNVVPFPNKRVAETANIEN